MLTILKSLISLVLAAQIPLAAAAAEPPAARAAADLTGPPAATPASNHGTPAAPAPTPDPADEALKQEVLTSLDELDESLDLIMARPAGQTEPSFAEDIIERSGLDPKGTVEKAKTLVSALDTTSQEFQEMKKGLARNNSWKTIGQKLTGKKNSDGTRSGGIFTSEVLEDLKTKKPKKKKSDDSDAVFFDERRAGRFGEVASLSRLYLDDGPEAAGARQARARGGVRGSLNRGGRPRHGRDFASVAYFDHETANCPAGSPLGLTDIYIARSVEVALDAVMEGLPTDGLTIAGRIAVVAARAAASGSVLVLEGLNDFSGECIEDSFKNSVDGKLASIEGLAAFTRLKIDNETNFTDDAELAALKTGLETHVTTAQQAVIANDNANRGQIIANDNANKEDAKNLLLRLQIEADLASDGATPVGLFASPATPQCAAVTAVPVNQCGLLDTSRQIVVQTIARIAGSSTARANAFLAKGDAYKNARNYKAAYQQYKMAYKAAVK